MDTTFSSDSPAVGRPRRWGRLLAALLLTIAATVSVGPLSAGAATDPCAVRWGSLTKSSDAYAATHLTNVRSGRHECFDRLVIDLDGPRTGYRVEYTDTLRGSASGEAIPTRGGAVISVMVVAPAYDDNGSSTYRPANRNELVNVSGYRTFRQVAWADSFEGRTSLGIGVRARLPFRVLSLAGPGGGSRLVIDVAHHW